MAAPRQLLPRLLRYGASAVVTFACWLLWIALSLLLAGQLYVATHDEVTVPDFILRGLEARLAEHGLHARFDRATFDPSGRVLVRKPQLFLEGYDDAVVLARAAYVDLDPWMLPLARIEARQIRLLDGTLQVPAMLSPSGHAEPVVDDLDALIVPGHRIINLSHVSGHIGRLAVSVHGEIPRAESAAKHPTDFVALARQRFGEFCRIAEQIVSQLDAFEQPDLDLHLEPSSNGVTGTATFTATSVKLETPVHASFDRIRAFARVPVLIGTTSLAEITLEVGAARLPHDVSVARLRATVGGRFALTERHVEPVAFEATADEIAAPEGRARGLSLVAHALGGNRWQAHTTGWVTGSALATNSVVDLNARSAEVDLSGTVSPEILGIVHGRTRVDIRKFFNFETAEIARAHVVFGPGGKFERLTGHAELRGIDAHGARIDEGFADVVLDPHRLYSPDAYVRLGPNFARGSYEHVFATKEFRFLLQGQLRPMDISAWFREWWPRFFSRLNFPVAPPAASVDVRGFWGNGRKTSVFVFADAKSPTVLTQSLARVRTRLFIRPGFYDGLELLVVDPPGAVAHGTFTLTTDVESGKWRHAVVDAESNVRFDIASAMASDLGQTLLAPFAVTQPPHVTVRGRFDGPALAPNRHQTLDLVAETTGPFAYYDLPLEDVTFTTALRDDVLTVDSQHAKFAGGTVHLHAKAWGETPERRIGFDVSVNDASFGEAIANFQRFSAKRKGLPPPTLGKFVREKANVRADLNVSAEGLVGNVLSFNGSGNAMLRGAEIGSVPLFGPLSELLKFSELRFTTAHATFKIAEKKIEFPNVTLRGANSAVDGHGDFLLDRRQLDFRAKVFPFQESDSVIKSVVGAVLSPISNALEVKLTGTLDKPEWAFVIGPTNFFRSLAPDQPNPKPEEKQTPAGTAKETDSAAASTKAEPANPAERLAPKPD